MNIAAYFIQRRVTSWLVALLLGIGGVIAFIDLGRLEDPAFTLKMAMVVTPYPGASPQQVEEELTYPLENAIQQLPYVDTITSTSSAGLSQIMVEVQAQYRAEHLPQIWDEMRRRINDLRPNLPPVTTAASCAITPTTCAASWCWSRALARSTWPAYRRKKCTWKSPARA